MFIARTGRGSRTPIVRSAMLGAAANMMQSDGVTRNDKTKERSRTKVLPCELPRFTNYASAVDASLEPIAKVEVNTWH